MEKSTEIQTLLSLKEDTYFSEFFTSSDIDKMCLNIKNDYPIEFNCAFMEQANALRRAIEEQKKKADAKLMSLVQDIILSINACTADDPNKIIEGYIGKDSLIKLKHANGIQLTEEELDYLVSKLK